MGTNWWSQWTPPLIQYGVLLRLFVDGRITGDEFEALFLPLYLHNTGNWPDGAFELLDSLFFDVDDYTGDSELRSRWEESMKANSGAGLPSVFPP